MDEASFYRAFEDRHRGPRELIKSRQEVYLPFLRPLKEIYPNSNAVDLGCGRGEWLELLAEEGFRPHGVDLDQQMLAPCRERGYSVEEKDAIVYLQELPDESQTIVSGFHIAEHIPFCALQNLVRQSLRVLKTGGLLILETPNPENLTVGSSNFYLDPTHERPLPPLLLSFLPEFYGFLRTKILRLQESSELLMETRPIQLIDVIAGVSPDYAVVAQKDGEANALVKFDEAFSRKYGLTAGDVAQRYDKRLSHMESAIERSDRLLAEMKDALSGITTRLEQKELEQHRRRIHALESEAAALQQQLDARTTRAQALENDVNWLRGELQRMSSSRSWRMTAPFRGAMGGARQVRAAVDRRARRLPQLLLGIARRVLSPAVRLAMRSPRLKRAGADLLTTRPTLKAHLLRLAHPGPPMPEHLTFGWGGNAAAAGKLSSELPEPARPIYAELQARFSASRQSK